MNFDPGRCQAMLAGRKCLLDAGHSDRDHEYLWDAVQDVMSTQNVMSTQMRDNPQTFDDVFQHIFDEAFDLLRRKQVSYGPENVKQLGFYGVFSRLSSDKVERLRNALSGTIEKGVVTLDFAETLSDESLEDTLFDIVNYAAILIALKRDQWGKPLA